jgi:electron transfer flavoprotein beta subunit
LNTICCIARVPDTAARIKIASDGKSPDKEGLQTTINPYDEFALEAALQLKESTGGQLVVIHVGPEDFQKELRQCLAKGADQAIQLTCSGPLGPHGIASIIATRMKEFLPATIFCGKQAVDGDVGGTGTMIAGVLGLPVLTKVSSLKYEGDKALVPREIEGALESAEAPLPCVITTEKGLNEPRRAGLKEIMAAKKKPLLLETVEAPAPKLVVHKLELPPPRKEGRILGEGSGAVPALLQALRNEAKVL